MSLAHWFLPYVPPANANAANLANCPPSFSGFSEISISKAENYDFQSDPISNVSGFSNSNPVDAENEAFEERAAIIEYQAQIPRKWAEAFARINLMRKPRSISAEDWQRVLDGTGKLLDGLVPELVKHGWEVADIFGCHPFAPARRYDVKGLLLLMRQNEVIAIINQDFIGLQNPQTGNTLFYRRPHHRSGERIMLWELP